MKILIEHFPEAASLVMDHCIKRSSHIRTDPNYTESYDFHLLDPGPDDAADLNGNRFFGPKTMVKFNREDLLLHPLTQKLLDVKWASFGRYIYYFNLIAYLVFLITYTIFIVTEREAQDFNPRKSENGTEKVKASEIFTRATAFNGAVLFVALIFAAVHIAKEILLHRRFKHDGMGSVLVNTPFHIALLIETRRIRRISRQLQKSTEFMDCWNYLHLPVLR